MKNWVCGLLLAVALARVGSAQELDASTPEGKLLLDANQEADAAKKQALLEDFIAKYPKHAGAAAAYTQLQTAYLAAQQFDKALDAGEKGLALTAGNDAGNLGLAYNNLKASEGKKDSAGVMKWAAETSGIARKQVETAKPDDDGKRQADYAHQVDVYTEYSLSASAVQSANPKDTIGLVETLIKQNPKSQYLCQGGGPYLRALQQSGQAAQTGPAAEQILAGDPKCDDALLFAADFNLNQKRNDKAADYASQLAEVLKSKAKPEGVADADWEKAKNGKLGLAYWYSGLAYSAAGKFPDADKVLRQAVPLLQDNQQALGVGLFNLGLSDYKMAKANGNKALLQDALKYSQQSAAIKGPLQTQAAQNVKAIRGELGIKGK